MANQEHIRQRKCSGKVPHYTGVLAVRHLERWTKSKDIDLYEFSVYPCEFCHFWHIGRGGFFPEKEITNEESHKMPGQMLLFRRARAKARSWINYNDPLFNETDDPNGKWSRPNSKERRAKKRHAKRNREAEGE